MFERKRFRRESIRTTVLFFVVFGLIFGALGIFVYQTVSVNLFQSVDRQLSMGGLEMIGSDAQSALVTDEPSVAATTDDVVTIAPDVETSEVAVPESISINATIEENPQIIFLIRSNAGIVEDTTGIYTTYSDSIKGLPFDTSVLNTIYMMEHEGHYYRAANYLIENEAEGSSSKGAYLQIVANVDSEIAILDQFTRTLIIGLAIALIVSAAASYLLSRYTLRPIAQAWEKQTEFVQNASHELRTPLTVIRTTQELLLTEPNARIVDKFEDITVTIEEADRLSRLTEDLLALTATEESGSGLETEQLDIDELITGTVCAYEELASLQEKNLVLALAGATTARANRDKARQLLAILLDNALKYTERGDTITVETQMRGNSAIVRVSDTGSGIDDEDLPHVFDRFYRADKARSRETGGNGLGLSIAQSIVNAHGGTIKMEHNEPSGATVVVELPR